MDSDTIWRHIDTERAALADILEGLPDDAWRVPSLCDAWTVRDVAAHLCLAQARLRDILGPAIRAGLRYNAIIRNTAVDSPLTHEEIVATLRGFLGSRSTAVGVTEREALIDTLVHTQDICVPLGIDHPVPTDAAVVALERVIWWSKRFPIGPRLRGFHLVATDLDWEWGSGRRVEGPVQWLLLAAAGRAVAHEHLTGDVRALA
jgi:uncharacterized protein (TIGR03083 family)